MSWRLILGRVLEFGAIRFLHPEDQVFDQMLTGWRNQQLSRNLAGENLHPQKRGRHDPEATSLESQHPPSLHRWIGLQLAEIVARRSSIFRARKPVPHAGTFRPLPCDC